MPGIQEVMMRQGILLETFTLQSVPGDKSGGFFSSSTLALLAIFSTAVQEGIWLLTGE